MNKPALHSAPKQPVSRPLLNALRGERQERPPFWFMRQAGRFLPEYRAVREKAGGFLNLVYTPELAAEVTLQPVRRFGMDAAILFSDILVIPQALGIDVTFGEGEGPRLQPVCEEKDIPVFSNERAQQKLAPVYETIRRVRAGLDAEGFERTTILGFAGAPWTMACYMIEGQGGGEFTKARCFACAKPEIFQKLIDEIIKATTEYLCAQIEAGADAVQIFDSWAGLVDECQFHSWVIGPTRKIVEGINTRHPGVPIIGFPRGAGILYQEYTEKTGVNALSLDQHVPLAQASRLQQTVTVQGNLDPVRLLAGGAALAEETQRILETLSSGPFVFNLGHGVHKDTPVEHVEQLVGLLRKT